MLARCDRERMPAYLESSTERSRALYERHGFQTTEVIRMPRGGPPLWLMWRQECPTTHADGGDHRAAERHLNQRLRQRDLEEALADQRDRHQLDA